MTAKPYPPDCARWAAAQEARAADLRRQIAQAQAAGDPGAAHAARCVLLAILRSLEALTR